MKWILLSSVMTMHIITAGKLVELKELEQRVKTIHARNRAHFIHQFENKCRIKHRDECSRLSKKFKKAVSELRCDIKDCNDELIKAKLIEIRDDFDRYEKKMRGLKRNLAE